MGRQMDEICTCSYLAWNTGQAGRSLYIYFFNFKMKPRQNFKLYSARYPGKKKKRQVNNWKKIFANHTSYKVLVSVIYNFKDNK